MFEGKRIVAFGAFILDFGDIAEKAGLIMFTPFELMLPVEDFQLPESGLMAG